MSSSSSEDDSGVEEATINGDDWNDTANTPTEIDHGSPAAGRIVELLEEAREAAPTPERLGNGLNRYKAAQQQDSTSEDGSVDAVPGRAGSPMDSVLSIPDDPPSVQVGQIIPKWDTAGLTNFTGLRILIARIFIAGWK